jgi:hypothetical protein
MKGKSSMAFSTILRISVRESFGFGALIGFMPSPFRQPNGFSDVARALTVELLS